MNTATLPFEIDMTLPMDLPEMPAPVVAPPVARRAPRARPRGVADQPSAQGVGVTLVEASTLAIDGRFGLDLADLAALHAAEIAEATTRLTANRPQAACPIVVRSEDGGYRALTALPIVIAALNIAALSPTPVMVQVIVWDAIDGELLVREMFTRARPATLFQQARYIAGCEALYGSRRAWMRSEGIDPKGWEPRFSKIAKIGRLDAWLLDEIDPHTISNAKVAGRIVDAWSDPEKRRIIVAMVEASTAASRGPVKAGPLFKRIDAALHPATPRFTAGAWVNGSRELVDADGTCLARLTRQGTDWSMTGGDIAVLTPALLASALQALTG